MNSDTENRLMFTRGRCWGIGKIGENGQNVQTFIYKVMGM